MSLKALLMFVAGTLIAALLVRLSYTPPRSGQAAADTEVYSDALSPGWVNWSWGAAIDLDSAAPAHRGSASISAAYSQAWAGVYLHLEPALPTSGVTAVRFWVHGGRAGGQSIAFKVIDAENGNWDNSFAITPQANTWTQVTVPLATVGSPATIGGLVWQDSRGAAQPVFYVDDVLLVGGTGSPAPTPVKVAGPAITIDAGADRQPISPFIYGLNYADEDLAAELRLPVRRWGGNSTTRYNWQIDTHNTGSDWYFENIPDQNAHPEQLPDGSTADRFVEQDRRTGTRTLMTVPLIGWTPKRRLESHPYDCGFKASKYGAQQSVDYWDSDCGNGVNAGGQNLTGNDPSDTSTAITPGFVQAWVNHLTGKYGTAANGGVLFYNLDNEPMLWPYTHRDVHPALTTYDELRDRTYIYAAALKAADPTAQTLGPVVWGWCAYFYSALDGCGPGTDYQSHNRTGLVEWYLQQMRLYEQQHGVRILDYVDVHFYPQASGVHADNAGNAATQALRLRSTRALWDQSYTDESWIGQPVSLIPRMREWVEKNYPGTKLAITEYSFGAQRSLNGALAQAEVLGIFGREGLDLATLWGPPSSSQPGAFAFRMYRNYDGNGGAFGETRVRAASADAGQLSIFAAQRARDGALTAIVINKTDKTLVSSLALSSFNPASLAQVYRYSADDLGAILRQPDQAIASNSFTTTFPASSITLLVIPPGSAPPPNPDVKERIFVPGLYHLAR